MYSQTFFSKIVDFGGDNMEGRIFNVIPLENEIKIIGDLQDSLVQGFDGGVWPILGSMTYEGEYLNTNYLADSAYSDGFIYFTRRIAYKNDSICYLYDRRDLGGPFLDAYLLELNYRTGKILRSKVIFDQISNQEAFLASDIGIGKDGTIFLVNVTDEWGPHPQILTVLDTDLIVKDQLFIPNFGRSNITKYIYEELSGNLVLVGVSLGQPTTTWFESKLFYQVLDSNYNSIDFKLAPTAYDQTIASYEFYPVIKAKNNEWVFATQVVNPTSNCSGCAIWIPYIVRISSDFTEVLSETRLFDGISDSNSPEYLVSSVEEVSDGYIMAGYSDGMFGIETSGFLGKVSLQGDSLWLRHYLPIEWDTVQARWFHWQDVKATPLGNIVIGGYGSDRFNSRIVPWILHLDANGCLEPGCFITSVYANDFSPVIEINIFPNPATEYCNIHVRLDQAVSKPYSVKVINNLGLLIHEIFILGNDSMLLLDLENYITGNYYIQLVDSKNQVIDRKKLIILK